MTTSTLELVDWATILDDEPACEATHGCDAVAANLVRYSCGCQILLCVDCTACLLRMLADYHPSILKCLTCGAEVKIRSAADFLTVIPL